MGIATLNGAPSLALKLVKLVAGAVNRLGIRGCNPLIQQRRHNSKRRGSQDPVGDKHRPKGRLLRTQRESGRHTNRPKALWRAAYVVRSRGSWSRAYSMGSRTVFGRFRLTR